MNAMNNIDNNNVSNELILQEPAHKPLRWWQKPKINISIALLGLALVIIIMTLNVTKYEKHLATGDTVLLELTPVDPRGFMQGDYMALRYALEDEVFNKLSESSAVDEYLIKDTEGYIVVTLDNNRVGKFNRLTEVRPSTLASNELAIHYRVRNGIMKLATNAFFFQEGHAQAFEAAEYGLFRINEKGEPLLTDIVNNKFKVIDPQAKSAKTTEVQNDISS